MRNQILLVLLATILLISACSSPQNSVTDDQQDLVIQIFTAAAQTAEIILKPTETQSSEVILPTETLPPTAPVLIQQTAPVVADLLNLRDGPGTFFNVLTTLPQGTQVTLLGMIPDGTWIKVSTQQGNGMHLNGWVFASLLDLSELQTSLTIEDWPPGSTISGIIADNAGEPINSVRVAATVQSEEEQLRAESNSDRSGLFNIYTPPELSGPIVLEIVAVNCSSRISDILPDGSCKVQDHYPVIWKTEVLLPQPELVRFVYEEGVVFLEGKVVYQDGNGASQILVKATRKSDGVESEFVTPQGGEFRLPLGLGTWEVIAIRFLQDGTPLLSETRVYEVTSPGQELEPLLISYTEIIER